MLFVFMPKLFLDRGSEAARQAPKEKKLKTLSEEFLAENHRRRQLCDLVLAAIMRKSSFRQKR